MSKTTSDSTPTTDEVVAMLRQLPPRERLRVVLRVLPELELNFCKTREGRVRIGFL